MPGITISANDDAALRQFNEDSFEDLAFRDHPLMGICRKDDEYGNAVKVPMKYAYGAGRGGTFSTAQTNISDVSRAAFLVTPSKAYGLGRVPTDDILLSQNKKGGVVNLLTDGVESAMRMCGDELEMLLFGDGSGTLATISSNAAGPPVVLTLTNPADAYKWEPGQIGVSKATAFAAALDAGTFTVTGTDPIAGTITVTAAGGWAAVNTHVIGRQGTMAASTSLQTYVGLAGWLPISRPTVGGGDSFFGVDRAPGGVLLAGHYADGRTLNVKQAVLKLAASIGNVSGSKPDVCMLNFAQYEKLETLVDTQGRNIQTKGDGITVYYDSIRVMGPKGPIACIPATFCPQDRIYVLDSSTWKLGAPGPIIQNALTNNEVLDVSTADSVEIRRKALGFFYSTAPGYNGVAQVTA